MSPTRQKEKLHEDIQSRQQRQHDRRIWGRGDDQRCASKPLRCLVDDLSAGVNVLMRGELMGELDSKMTEPVNTLHVNHDRFSYGVLN